MKKQKIITIKNQYQLMKEFVDTLQSKGQLEAKLMHANALSYILAFLDYVFITKDWSENEQQSQKGEKKLQKSQFLTVCYLHKKEDCKTCYIV